MTYYAAKMRGSKKKKPLAETTVAHHHAMLKTAYNWALEEELLLLNPALRVKNPPALRPKTRPKTKVADDARPPGRQRRRARRPPAVVLPVALVPPRGQDRCC